MKYLNFTISIFLSSALFIACGSDSTEKKAEAMPEAVPVNNSITPSTQPNAETSPATSTSTAAKPVTPNITSNPQVVIPSQPVTVSAPVVTQTNTTQTSTAKGLNPAHGQPGHRCDISVGAPLNSSPTTQPSIQQPTIIQQPAVTTTPPKTYISDVQKSTPAVITAPPTTVVAEGMNPEHGKPGHRCDISVGAPLNSKPKQ